MKKVLLLAMLSIALFASSTAMAQSMKVSGTVIAAEDGLPIIGATVLVKGTQVAVPTDVNGMYTITVPQSAEKVLQVSYVGLEPQEKPVTRDGEVINFELEQSAQHIEEVQVMGYGTARKIGTVVGSVTQVTTADLENRPTASVVDALQGKVAGLQIYTSTGDPAQTQSVRLHGIGSLGSSSTPLYIVDGLPVEASIVLAMNPNDFESVSIMKDAAATSIYGARAANGVIVYTTKRGTLGKAKITANAQYGISTMASTAKDFYNSMMSTDQLWDFWLTNSMVSQTSIDSWTALGYDQNNTNWAYYFQKEYVPTYQADVSISGGTESTRYYISGSMYHQDGTAHRSYYDRYTVRSNVDSKVTDWMNIGVNAMLYTDDYNYNPNWGSNYLSGGLSYLFAPFYSPYDSDGNEYWDESIPGVTYNPAYYAEMNPYENKTFGTASTAYITLTPIDGLTIKSQAGVDYSATSVSSMRMASYAPYAGNGAMAIYDYATTRATITNTIEYTFDVAEGHNLTLLAGQEGISYNYDYNYAYTSGLTDDRLMQLGFGSQSTYSVSSSNSQYAFLSFFGRASYSYEDKLYADVTVRNDESSRFSPENRSALFYAVGARWNIKNTFFKNSTGPVTDLSFQASYGTQGNSEIGNYSWQATMGSIGSYQDASTMAITDPGNFSLAWEQQEKLTIGVNVSLWNRLNLTLEYYSRETTNMLMAVPQPGTSAFSEIYENVGGLRNSGIDIQLDFDIFRERDYWLNFSANFNYNKEVITELFQGLDRWEIANTGVAYVVGQPVSFYYPIYAGVDTQTGEMQWYVPGDNIDETTMNEVTTVYDEDALTQNTGVSRYAPIAGGFSISGGWKGISLQADFSYVLGKYLISNDRFFTENPYYFLGYNTSSNILNSWKNPGDVVYYPDWSTPQYMQFDTHLLENASFMRLKNLTLGYQFPSKWFKNQNVVSGFKVYLTGRNLWTITDPSFSGVDPEVDSNLTLGNIPNSTQYILGIQLTF